MPSTKDRRPAGTLNALCAALKLSKRQVSTLLKQGMPDTVAEAVAWHKAEDSSDSAEQLRRERILLVREQRTKAKIENQRLSGELLSRAAVQERDTKIGAVVAAGLRALENELPQIALGLPLERSRPLIKAKIREVQGMMADEFGAYWKENPETE